MLLAFAPFLFGTLSASIALIFSLNSFKMSLYNAYFKCSNPVGEREIKMQTCLCLKTSFLYVLPS